MRNAYISGTGFYVPPQVITNQGLADRFGIDTTDAWIEQRTGIRERRFAPEGVGCADLALPAAREALDRAGVRPDEIEMILFATLSPDRAFPGSGVLLQAALGMPGVPAMDIRNQCCGFLYGLATATSMVRAGAARHVLLVGAEVQSAALDLTTRGRAVASIFGDGAGAVVVSATDEDRGVRAWHLGADGRHADCLSQKIWDIRRRPFIPVAADGAARVEPEMLWAQMDGRQVYKHAVERMTASLAAVLWDQKMSLDEVDLVLFHQANLRINQTVQAQLGLPSEKAPHNIDRYGNTTAATIPILLAEQDRLGKLKRGTKVAMVAFGSGFTWGAALIEW